MEEDAQGISGLGTYMIDKVDRQGAGDVCSLFQKRLARAWLFLA